ncbi:unnamed protein product [Brachionus calyciflorus]|uniref:SWIM-type domain-containing protein n=1 Tax=Brachionus calyciflorus TaxID=104777 RepID=A0A813ZFV5_9BILA|nr:unnamed protein product [Brachionus calyciflorus]
MMTKCRWVIEAINGILKESFRSLSQVRNTMLKHIMVDFKVIVIKLTFENELEKIIKNLEFTNSHEFIDIEKANFFNDFPKLSYNEILENITLVSYHLKQSLSYLAEHFDNNGKFKMKIKAKKIVLSSNLDRLYLTESSKKNDTLINGWYCTCKNGKRTVGCCSHVSSVIYYFGYARYLENIPKPASFLSDIFLNVFIESTDDEIDETTQSTQKKRKKNSQKKSKTKTFSSDSDKTIHESEKEDEGEPSIPNSNDREKNKSTPLDSLPIALNIDFLLCDLNYFINHVPSWVGLALTRIRLGNTCTIDYFLLDLCFSNNRFNRKNEWNKSKSIWITDVLKKTINHNGNYDLFGDQTENIDIHLQTL